MNVRKSIFRWIIYLAGMILLAFGLTLNTKLGLGVSAIMTISVTISEIWSLNLGNITLAVYTLFVVMQMVIHFWQKRGTDRKALGTRLLMDALQLPLSLLFTRVMNLVSRWLPVFGEVYAGTFWGSLWGRIILLVAAIVLTGIGVSMSLNMRLVPNPGDGIVQVLAEVTGKPVGFTKNWFDILNICIALILGFVFAGGLVGVNVGTVLAAIGIGRVIAAVNRLLGKKMKRAAGLI